MNENEQRVLILASTRRDAEYSQRILSEHKLNVFICEAIDELIEETQKGTATLLLAREMLTPVPLKKLNELLSALPSWSHLPLVILTAEGDFGRAKAEALHSLRVLRNATYLERPVRIATLVSVLQSAVANRMRQYEVRDLLIALEASRVEAVRANQAKSEFLANMSHEIRTPLGAVLGFSELMANEKLNSIERASYSHTIKRNGSLLSALIDDILDLAKVEAGRIDIESVDISVLELAGDVISLLEPNASAKNLHLNLDLKKLGSDLVSTDPVRLKQILMNIVGNAIKFTHEGEVTLTLQSEIHASGSIELTATVRDTGTGISSDQSKRLFKPFAQADSSTTRAYGGTGLGLVLSRQLAQAMGGDLVLLESELGRGSTFQVKVLVRPSSDSAQIRRPSRLTMVHSEPSLDGSEILLVEDSPDNRFLITRMLNLAGARVDIAQDGLEGTEKALKGQYDLVLMDVQMPRMGGHEAVANLRKTGYTIPVVALTAHALKGERERCLASGFSEYLSKPVQREKLIRTVHSILSTSR